MSGVKVLLFYLQRILNDTQLDAASKNYFKRKGRLKRTYLKRHTNGIPNIQEYMRQCLHLSVFRLYMFTNLISILILNFSTKTNFIELFANY